MRLLAAWLVKSRFNAGVVIASFALLFLPAPAFGVVSSAAVALVVLRFGHGFASAAVLFALLIGGLFLQLALGAADTALVLLLGLWLPVWLAAGVLRRYRSLPLAMLAASLFSVGLVLLIHAVLADPAATWAAYMKANWSLVQSQMGVEVDDPDALIASVVPYMNLLLAAMVALFALLGLLLGRFWQALQMNPGGFREEFHRLRLGRSWVLLSGMALVLGFVLDWPIVRDGGLLLALPFLFQGLAVLHGALGILGASVWPLVFIYLGLLFLPMLALPPLLLFGAVDNWTDVRSRLGSKMR